MSPKRIAALLALTVVGLIVVPASSAQADAPPEASAAAAINARYAKGVIRDYIEDKYTVAVGPYFGACTKLAWNEVRCEVQFKAGLYWRCGRVTVRNASGYDYIDARLPIGC